MTDFHTLLDSINDKDMLNPVIAELVREMYDPSDCSDAVELAAVEELNDCLMAMVEEEKAKQVSSSCHLADPDELTGVDTGADLPNSPDCDLFNNVSIIEIQKDKKSRSLRPYFC